MCGVFESFGETVAYPALGDRYTLSLPIDARAEHQPRESHFLMEREGARLAVMVFETFGSATDDLAAVIAANDDTGGTVARLRLPSGLDAAIVEPHTTWGPSGGVVLGTGWVNGPDGTVVSIAVVADEGLAPTASMCRAVARRILTSVAPGTARLDLAGGERELDGYRIELPARHVLAAEPGVDFQVYRVFPVTPLDQPTAQLGLYLGQFPSFSPVGTEVPGELLGEPVSWFQHEQEGWTQMDAVAPAGADGRLVHVFLSAPTEAGALALRGIAETLRRAD
jgi:hypothetical protein